MLLRGGRQAEDIKAGHRKQIARVLLLRRGDGGTWAETRAQRASGAGEACVPRTPLSPLLGPPRLNFFLDSPPFFFSRSCSFTTRMKPGNTCASKWSLDVARRRGSGTGKLPWLRRLLGKHAEFGGGGRKRPELIPLLTLEESILNLRMGLSNLSIRMGGITPTFSRTTAYFKHVIKQDAVEMCKGSVLLGGRK